MMAFPLVSSSRTWIAYWGGMASPKVLKFNGYFFFCSFNSSLQAEKSNFNFPLLDFRILFIPCNATFISAQIDTWGSLFFPISAESISICTIFARLANASSFPVTRSSNLTPNASNKSA
uniref:Uncharacterized protein n=1 Tax=Opuntia streptacantha TaxID=393608 RepID=A0A7C9ERF3_OPUST